MYDNYEDEYEHDTEVEDTAGWWIPLVIYGGGIALVFFTLGAIAGSVFG